MLKDSQLKVALLRMKISSLEASGSPEPGEASQGREGGTLWPRLKAHLHPAGPDLLAEELQHRLRVEAAVAAGAKNVVKLLGGQRMQDRKALAEVRLCPQLTALYSSACVHPLVVAPAPRACCLWRVAVKTHEVWSDPFNPHLVFVSPL